MLFVKPNIGQPHTSPQQHPILAVAIKVFNMQSIRITRLTAIQILASGFLNQAGQLSTQLHIKFEYHYTRLPGQEFCNSGQPLRPYNSFILLNLHSLHAGGSQCSSAMSSSSSRSGDRFRNFGLSKYHLLDRCRGPSQHHWPIHIHMAFAHHNDAVCREACITSTRPFLGLASGLQDYVEWPMA